MLPRGVALDSEPKSCVVVGSVPCALTSCEGGEAVEAGDHAWGPEVMVSAVVLALPVERWLVGGVDTPRDVACLS